jgi:hypothetical protein
MPRNPKDLIIVTCLIISVGLSSYLMGYYLSPSFPDPFLHLNDEPAPPNWQVNHNLGYANFSGVDLENVWADEDDHEIGLKYEAWYFPNTTAFMCFNASIIIEDTITIRLTAATSHGDLVAVLHPVVSYQETLADLSQVKIEFISFSLYDPWGGPPRLAIECVLLYYYGDGVS